MVNIKPMGGCGCSTAVEPSLMEQNSWGRGFDSCRVLGFFLLFLSLGESFIRSHKEVHLYRFSFTKNKCLAVQFGAKQHNMQRFGKTNMNIKPGKPDVVTRAFHIVYTKMCISLCRLITWPGSPRTGRGRFARFSPSSTRTTSRRSRSPRVASFRLCSPFLPKR